MGNNCCESRNPGVGANFDKKEKKKLKEMFKNLTDSSTEYIKLVL